MRARDVRSPHTRLALALTSIRLHSHSRDTTPSGSYPRPRGGRVGSFRSDGCVVRLLSDDGWLTAAAVHMPVEARISDPELLARVRAHMTAPHHIAEESRGRHVIETGEAELVPRLDLERL